MRWLIVGVVAICLGGFFWLWALQDGSFGMAAGPESAEGAEWQRRAEAYVWIGYGLFATAVAAFVTAWLTGRQKSPPRE
jgi:hypothetical protein